MTVPSSSSSSRLGWLKPIRQYTNHLQNKKVKLHTTINRKKIILKKLTQVVLKILQGTKYEADWGELIPVFSRSWEKGKFEHIFLTVGLKKVKVARPCFFRGIPPKFED